MINSSENNSRQLRDEFKIPSHEEKKPLAHWHTRDWTLSLYIICGAMWWAQRPRMYNTFYWGAPLKTIPIHVGHCGWHEPNQLFTDGAWKGTQLLHSRPTTQVCRRSAININVLTFIDFHSVLLSNYIRHTHTHAETHMNILHIRW